MAQPSDRKLAYLGAIAVKANVLYTKASLLTLYNATATISIVETDIDYFMLKNKKIRDNAGLQDDVEVAINGMSSVPLEYNEKIAFLNSTMTYLFLKPCQILLAKEVTA